ncbi:MAG: hypothetical protein HC881_01510 [Leptolyngbyaceae cyanobacterium SL_7_1]|nr:hypothetical protein [Leptolyngbyaceae cyanobacterium SL_7_1]
MQDIDPDTHSWQLAQPDLTEWSKTLTAVSLKRWQSGDLEGRSPSPCPCRSTMCRNP